MEATVKNTKDLEEHINRLRSLYAKHGAIKVSVKSAKTRTLTQNRAIHKYCAMLSEAFNDAGLDMMKVLAEGTSFPWTEDRVKDLIWRKVQIAALGKESTTKLETAEVGQVYDIINRHLSQTFGLSVPFPSLDELMHQAQGNTKPVGSTSIDQVKFMTQSIDSCKNLAELEQCGADINEQKKSLSLSDKQWLRIEFHYKTARRNLREKNKT